MFPLNRKVILASAITMASQVSFVQAAGYGINEQSANYLGTGFAGRASNAIDASISATNPAGISFLEGGTQISVGADVILEGGKATDLKYAGNPNAPSSTKDFQKTGFVPFGYLVMPIDEKWSFGLAGYAPYGIKLDYEDGWAGESFGDKTTVQVMNLQGTLAYKFNDDLSLGFGLIGSHVKGELTSKPFTGADATIEGDDNAIAWNIGALWNVSDQTSLGIAYHSKLDFKLEGDMNVNIDGLGAMPTKSVELGIVMPEKLMLSGTHRLDQRWAVMADVTWTRWSRFEEFNVVNSSTGKTENYVPMGWKDTWAVSVGTSYQLDESWLLRAGYMFDESPVKNDTRTVRSPDANRNWFTLGANLKASEAMNIDFAYAYVKLQDGTIDEQKYAGPGKPSSTSPGPISGTYSSSSHIIGVQMNYIF